MESSLEATPMRWADICLEEFGAGSIGELAAEEICPNAIVLVEEVAANSLPIIGRRIVWIRKRCLKLLFSGGQNCRDSCMYLRDG